VQSEICVTSEHVSQSKEQALLIKQTFEGAVLLELYPRSQISIFVQVVQSDGGTY
jgi:exosome complex component RRP41